MIFWLLSLAWIIFSLTVKIFYIFIAKKILVNTSKFYISYSSENSINLENSISTFYQCRIYFGAIIQIFPILSVLFYEFNICGIFLNFALKNLKNLESRRENANFPKIFPFAILIQLMPNFPEFCSKTLKNLEFWRENSNFSSVVFSYEL